VGTTRVGRDAHRPAARGAAWSAGRFVAHRAPPPREGRRRPSRRRSAGEDVEHSQPEIESDRERDRRGGGAQGVPPRLGPHIGPPGEPQRCADRPPRRRGQGYGHTLDGARDHQVNRRLAVIVDGPLAS
jgi:hypothetical protein